MSREITTSGLTLGSVYKLVGVSMLFSLVPFSLLMGLCALAGYGTVTWNGRPLTGIAGLIASPFIGLFIAVMFTALWGSLVALGLKLYAVVVGPLTFRLKDG